MPLRSKNRIIQDLTQKGISKDIYEDILDELYSEDSDAEIEQIKALLAKKHFDPENSDYEQRQKITTFLMRKGYSLSDIQKAMKTE